MAEPKTISQVHQETGLSLALEHIIPAIRARCLLNAHTKLANCEKKGSDCTNEIHNFKYEAESYETTCGNRLFADAQRNCKASLEEFQKCLTANTFEYGPVCSGLYKNFDDCLAKQQIL